MSGLEIINSIDLIKSILVNSESSLTADDLELLKKFIHNNSIKIITVFYIPIFNRNEEIRQAFQTVKKDLTDQKKYEQAANVRDIENEYSRNHQSYIARLEAGIVETCSFGVNGLCLYTLKSELNPSVISLLYELEINPVIFHKKLQSILGIYIA